MRGCRWACVYVCHEYVCVCACVRACVRVCVCVCVYVGGGGGGLLCAGLNCNNNYIYITIAVIVLLWYYTVAGELCKLARVTGPEFPPALLSSRTLPASDWPVPRYGIKDSACSVSVHSSELCDSRGGRPGLSVLTSLLVSVDVKNY